MTPESLYSSESSNRSTAQVQLTDPKTGHVLFIEFCQEFLKKWIERTLINPELEEGGYKEGDAYITFQTTEADLDTSYLEVGDDSHNDNQLKNKDGSTAITTDPDPYDTHRKKEE